MMRKDLAAALGISGSMVTKLAKRGMPTDDVERAQRWRRRHLEPGRVKGVRVGTSAPAAASADSIKFEVVRRLAASAEDNFALWADRLRNAMRQVPQHLRARVQLPLDVWRQLLPAEMVAECQGEAAADEKLTATELEDAGLALFEVACGLRRWGAGDD